MTIIKGSLSFVLSEHLRLNKPQTKSLHYKGFKTWQLTLTGNL